MQRAGGNAARIDAIAFYARVAEQFHSSYRTQPNRASRVAMWRNFLSRFAGSPNLAYDIGCGSGFLACELAARGVTTIGIDGSEEMLDIARREAAARGFHNISFRQMVLPPTGSVDLPKAELIVSSSFIEYIESLPGILSFFRSHLTDGGTLIISVSNRESYTRRLVRFIHALSGYPEYLDHIRHFVTTAEIEHLLAGARFRVIAHEYYEGADRLNRMLLLFVPRRNATNMIILAARAYTPTVSTS
jgi:SAM-dependent methyltransferase